MLKEFSKLCTPAKIYLTIALIASVIVLFKGVHPFAVIIKLLFAFIWAYILNVICNKGYTGISWILVLFPYICLIITLMGLKILHNDPTGLVKAFNLNKLF